MSNAINWYFDFISPYAYLQQARFPQFPKEIVIQPKPVLFAGLLNHWEHKGPAEIPTKRIFTYQYVVWLGNKLGIPLRMPPAHGHLNRRRLLTMRPYKPKGLIEPPSTTLKPPWMEHLIFNSPSINGHWEKNFAVKN